MRSPSHPSRGMAGLLFLILVSLAFAGCFGDEDVPDPKDEVDPTPTTSPTPTTGSGGGDGGDDDNESDEVVPEAHYHHYWGEMQRAVLFDGTVVLDHSECLSEQQRQRPPCIGETAHIGSTIFTPEDDEWDVNQESDEANINGYVDTVFTGTKEVVAMFEWDETDPMLGDKLRFYYKPANSPMFLPREDQTPIFLTADDRTVNIEVGPGMSDPAHQYWVSRWAFMLVAEGGPQADWQFPVRHASGEVTVTIEIVNGGKQSIDPPHPDPWKGRDVLDLGKTTGSLQVTSVRAESDDATIRHAIGNGHEDIQLPVRSTVPAGTDKLVVKAWLNHTTEASKQVEWGLKYRGANTMSYTRVPDHTAGDDGSRLYEITVLDVEVDPPYERESYFRFGFYPIVGDQDEVGSLEAEYTLLFEVVKQPGFTYNF